MRVSRVREDSHFFPFPFPFLSSRNARSAKRSVYSGPAGDIRHRLAAAQLSQPLPRNPGQIPFRYSRLFISRNFATFLLFRFPFHRSPPPPPFLIVHAGFPLFDYY